MWKPNNYKNLTSARCITLNGVILVFVFRAIMYQSFFFFIHYFIQCFQALYIVPTYTHVADEIPERKNSMLKVIEFAKGISKSLTLVCLQGKKKHSWSWTLSLQGACCPVAMRCRILMTLIYKYSQISENSDEQEQHSQPL